ncbi:unnamed protein product [Rotaria sordida]|uniref:Uncharacterized protein n=1 Tax=Rotaria sordida TaxID=392033 RepID=A0A815JVY1_9BILA|nr:unnamed protein product [Rotaria sordida]CAF3978851.1 unnamed protein product [Rotaria sordida]CAF4164027.1 unnamed protein product [Rotaria sordida]
MCNSGFHGSSIDIFETTEKNRTDSSHFLAWIDRTACLLRNEFEQLEEDLVDDDDDEPDSDVEETTD